MRKFSKKQIGAVGLVVIMSAQGPVMAAEVAQEETASEVSTTEIAEQKTERIEDESVEKVLSLLTFLPMEEVKRLSALKDEHINEAKKVAAYEITKLIHGEEEAKKAEEASNALFNGKGSIENMPSTKLEDINISIIDALIKTEIAPSKSQARTLITQNSISLNDNKITDCNYTLSEKDFVEGYAIVKKGKKVFHKLEK